MTSIVYYGSPRQARLEAKETLPAKLDLFHDRLQLGDRGKDETVALKMHVGNNIGYSVIHPVFVRKVVQAIKDGGGKPFVADVDWDVIDSTTRGYTAEVLGCPVYPIAGPKDKYFYTHQREYKNIKEWKVGGMIADASFLVNFAHIKGHPSCGFGGAFKNIALGCMIGETRGAMHDTAHYAPYWFADKCRDPETVKRIIASCPPGAVVEDKERPGEIHLHTEPCNQCMRCQQVAPPGSLKLEPETFFAFQEACAISVGITLSTFAPGKAIHLALATHMTPLCDCFGFTSMPILPDAGVFGSDDIVALDQAVLDMTAKTPLIEENIPTSMEVVSRKGHPFSWIHGVYKDPYRVTEYGEKLGLGSRQYELVDVLPVEDIRPAPMGYIPAS